MSNDKPIHPDLYALVRDMKQRGWFWEDPSPECRARHTPPRDLLERAPEEDWAGLLWRLTLSLLIVEFHSGNLRDHPRGRFDAMRYAAQGHLVSWLGPAFGLEFDDSAEGVVALRDQIQMWGIRRFGPSQERIYEHDGAGLELFQDERFEPAMTLAYLEDWAELVPIKQHNWALRKAREAHRRAKRESRDPRADEEEHGSGIDYDGLIAYHDLLCEEQANSYIKDGQILLSWSDVRDQLIHVLSAEASAGSRERPESPTVERPRDSGVPDPSEPVNFDSEVADALEVLELIDEARDLNEDRLRERIAEIRAGTDAARVAAHLRAILGVGRPHLAKLFGITEEKIRWAERDLTDDRTDA